MSTSLTAYFHKSQFCNSIDAGLPKILFRQRSQALKDLLALLGRHVYEITHNGASDTRSRSCRMISRAASRFTERCCALFPAAVPELTSITVIASVFSMTIFPPDGSHTLRPVRDASWEDTFFT